MTDTKDIVTVVPNDPFAEKIEAQVHPVVDKVVKEMNEAANSEYIQVTASRVTPNIPAKVRSIIYDIGIWAGVVGAIAAPIAAVLTGDAQVAVNSVGALALALTNLLAKLNLSKTAEDIAKQTA